MKIALVSRLDDQAARARIREVCPEVSFLQCWDDRDRLAAQAEQLQIVFGNVREHEFDALPHLQWVHATWSGIENLLYPKMVNSDVIITNTRGQVAAAMSEHALAALMYLSRDLPTMVRASRARQWRPDQYEPRLLAQSTVLVLGTGAVAHTLIPLLNGLGADVVGVNSDGRAVPGCRATYTLQTIGPALGEVDHIVILLPATKRTEHAIDEAFLRKLKPGAGIVNLARGSIIDQDAMVRLIEAGHLRGAVLDVTTPEPPPADSELFNHDRILLTGHRCWQPSPGNGLAFETFIHNLRCFMAGEVGQMRCVVDKQAGY